MKAYEDMDSRAGLTLGTFAQAALEGRENIEGELVPPLAG